jgi:hypothetical protein
MSNGSATLVTRDPQTFHVIDKLDVKHGSTPVSQLNELECVGKDVYANVWQSNSIVQINTRSGDVTRVIDASGLLTEQQAAHADVLNGIAYDPGTKHFFITGKLWPSVFEVEFPELPTLSNGTLPAPASDGLASAGSSVGVSKGNVSEPALSAPHVYPGAATPSTAGPPPVRQSSARCGVDRGELRRGSAGTGVSWLWFASLAMLARIRTRRGG